jgi:hypothetical protein
MTNKKEKMTKDELLHHVSAFQKQYKKNPTANSGIVETLNDGTTWNSIDIRLRHGKIDGLRNGGLNVIFKSADSTQGIIPRQRTIEIKPVALSPK